MRLIGVIDLQRGRAVHARGGVREAYRPVESAVGVSVGGDAARLAAVYRQLGVDTLYVADLDTIEHGTPISDTARQLMASAPVWLDAAIGTAGLAREALNAGAARVVVGLETLESFEALAGIVDAATPARVTFSLDLREGVPITRPRLGGLTVDDLVRGAVGAGATSLIVLDVARVGSARGVDAALVRRIRGMIPEAELIAGGGVRNGSDVAALAAAGADAVLVASALHDGRLAVHGNVTR